MAQNRVIVISSVVFALLVLSICFVVSEYGENQPEDPIDSEFERLVKSPFPYSKIDDRAGLGPKRYEALQKFLEEYRMYEPPRRFTGKPGYSPFISRIDKDIYGRSGVTGEVYIVWTTYYPLPAIEGNELAVSWVDGEWEVNSYTIYKR